MLRPSPAEATPASPWGGQGWRAQAHKSPFQRPSWLGDSPLLGRVRGWRAPRHTGCPCLREGTTEAQPARRRCRALPLWQAWAARTPLLRRLETGRSQWVSVPRRLTRRMRALSRLRPVSQRGGAGACGALLPSPRADRVCGRTPASPTSPADPQRTGQRSSSGLSRQPATGEGARGGRSARLRARTVSGRPTSCCPQPSRALSGTR
mmetsp:Transcript_2915/g.11876  ORF Transcript_2915/g.11876 Transcript_2915/m.11876 type:complete len:207 (-) Transcript_2915:48-668(-)